MVFTRLGRIVAFLALIAGFFRVATGVLIAAGAMGPQQAALARIFGSTTTGAVIDGGIYAIIFAIALGILTEISQSVLPLS